MAAVKTADRVSLAGMREIVTRALAQGDYEHDCEWINGGPVTVPTPPGHVVTLDILTAALPAPDTDGTVGKQQAALAVLSVIEERLLPHPYTLRAHSLVKRLTAEAEAWEKSTGLAGKETTSSPAVPVSVLTCQWCQAPIPLARGPKARYCRNSHRVSAHKAKKRPANATAAAGR